MNDVLKVLFGTFGLCHAQHSDHLATNTPLSDLVRGAFINYWPLLNRPDLQHLRSASLKSKSFQDNDDCAKKLLCELARKKERTWDEELMYTYYDKPVNYMSDSLFFNIAVQVGKDGERDCQEAYPSCILKLPEMLKIIRRQGISFELPADELECQVYVVWRKKDRNEELPLTKDIALKSEEAAAVDLFKNPNKNVITNKKSEEEGPAAMKRIEIVRTKSESMLQQESDHRHKLVDHTIKRNSTNHQKKINQKDEFMDLESEKPIMNITEPVELGIDSNQTLHVDELVLKTPEENHDNITKLSINQKKAIQGKDTKNGQTVEIGDVTNQADYIPETTSKHSQGPHQTSSGIINSLVKFSRRKSNDLQKNNLKKGSQDDNEVANDTNLFREGALGGVIGGVIGGLLGVYRSFV